MIVAANPTGSRAGSAAPTGRQRSRTGVRQLLRMPLSRAGVPRHRTKGQPQYAPTPLSGPTKPCLLQPMASAGVAGRFTRKTNGGDHAFQDALPSCNLRLSAGVLESHQ